MDFNALSQTCFYPLCLSYKWMHNIFANWVFSLVLCRTCTLFSPDLSWCPRSAIYFFLSSRSTRNTLYVTFLEVLCMCIAYYINYLLVIMTVQYTDQVFFQIGLYFAKMFNGFELAMHPLEVAWPLLNLSSKASIFCMYSATCNSQSEETSEGWNSSLAW